MPTQHFLRVEYAGMKFVAPQDEVWLNLSRQQKRNLVRTAQKENLTRDEINEVLVTAKCMKLRNLLKVNFFAASYGAGPKTLMQLSRGC